MRLWSIHPRYLDVKGLSGMWREALLAQAVLCGKTMGYSHHPQLTRFRAHRFPVVAISWFLSVILEEANGRGYSFDGSKIVSSWSDDVARIPVTNGQVAYERNWLASKLLARSREVGEHSDKIESLTSLKDTDVVSPVFDVVHGSIEPWEKVRPV